MLLVIIGLFVHRSFHSLFSSFIISFLGFYYRSSLARLYFILFLSLLFPYYSLVAHNISLVAPLLLLSLISFARLSFYLSFIAHFIRSSLAHNISLVALFLLSVFSLSLVTMFLAFSFSLSSLLPFSSLFIVRSSLASLALHFSPLCSPFYYRSLLAHSILPSIIIGYFIVHRSFHSLFSMFMVCSFVALLSLLSLFSYY